MAEAGGHNVDEATTEWELRLGTMRGAGGGVGEDEGFGRFGGFGKGELAEPEKTRKWDGMVKLFTE
jgi:hypothetical protein